MASGGYSNPTSPRRWNREAEPERGQDLGACPFHGDCPPAASKDEKLTDHLAVDRS